MAGFEENTAPMLFNDKPEGPLHNFEVTPPCGHAALGELKSDPPKTVSMRVITLV
jgi:hypothetical protein